MDLGLDGRVALVAAASRGLGRAVATTLAAEGARVALCARDRDTLEQTADRICADTGAEVLSVVADLATPDGPARFVDEAARHFGGVDVLVTNCGGPPAGPFEALDEASWEAAVQLVLMSAVRLTRAAVPHMTARGGGSVVAITSISLKEPVEGLLLSNATRPAVGGLCKTLARELGPAGIRVNVVCPGRIATDRLLELDRQRAADRGQSLEQVRADHQRSIPLGRYGQPEELAALVAFLASRRASYITGATLLCDGGLARGLS